MAFCKQLNSNPYDRLVYIVIAQNCEEGSKYVDETFPDHVKKDKLYNPKDKNNARGYEVRCRFWKDEKQNVRFFIIIDEKDLEDTTIEHELIHLTWDILDYCGIVITPDNHEAMTYLFEHLLKQCREAAKEYQQPKTKKK
jgi:hypothetical protein